MLQKLIDINKTTDSDKHKRIILMSSPVIRGSRKNYTLQIDVTTSVYQEHNSFDYQTTMQELSPTISSLHHLSLEHQFVHIYRNNKTYQMYFHISEGIAVVSPPHGYDHLAYFEIRYVNKCIILRFFEHDQVVGNSKYAQVNTKALPNQDIHQIYVIVRSIKNEQQQSTGFKLKQGSFLKIGQKQYFVSSLCSEKDKQQYITDKIMTIDTIINQRKKVVVPDINYKGQCKYCMMEEGQGELEFLCSPCKCSGSCALVHFACLQKWNQSKVKKNKVKGLTYYNFEKFFCEVCKEQYPKVIEKKGKAHELMPIELPKGEHLILEEVQMKNSSLICIEDIPAEGIRMGRGNECEIKVDSPSISRNHARIMKKYGQYYVFDNKSKFGTLVKDNKMYLQVDSTKKGIQIDRSVFMFSIVKKPI